MTVLNPHMNTIRFIDECRQSCEEYAYPLVLSVMPHERWTRCVKVFNQAVHPDNGKTWFHLALTVRLITH